MLKIKKQTNSNNSNNKKKQTVNKNIHTGCPRVAKKLHNLFVIKDIKSYFFLDSYATLLLHIRKILRYIYSVSQYYKNTKVMFF
jgi:hypothetical protein